MIGTADRVWCHCSTTATRQWQTAVVEAEERAAISAGTTRGGVQLLSANDGLAAGEEVTIIYGDERGNSSLLQRYGFVVEGNEEDTCDMDVQQLATIARDMGATPQPAAKQRKTEHTAMKAAADGDREEKAVADEEDEEVEDDGADELVDQLPEEFIPLVMPPPYTSPATRPPLPLRLLKLTAALLSYYPTNQLILHTDTKPFSLSLPLRLHGRPEEKEAVDVVDVVGRHWVTSEELRLEAEEELDVLQLLWVALNERLAVLGVAEDESGDKTGQGESEEDERRRRMAEVLKASERRIVTAHCR